MYFVCAILILFAIIICACVEIITSESDVFHGIFFQDQEMRHVFCTYPEILFIDATYKLLELRFPVYVLLVEDGNGQSELAAVFLLLEETEISISAMVNAFKKRNSKWESVSYYGRQRHD